MIHPGPSIEQLTTRLRNTPEEFTLPPRIGRSGVVHVDALVADLLRELGAPHQAVQGALGSSGRRTKKRERLLGLVMLVVWLLNDEWVQRAQVSPESVERLLEGLQPLADEVSLESFREVPDRQEELCRWVLHTLGIVPDGESPEQAEDILKSLSTIERNRLRKATAAAEKRSKEVLEALRKKASEAAAAKVSRE